MALTVIQILGLPDSPVWINMAITLHDHQRCNAAVKWCMTGGSIYGPPSSVWVVYFPVSVRLAHLWTPDPSVHSTTDTATGRGATFVAPLTVIQFLDYPIHWFGLTYMFDQNHWKT